MADNRTLQPRLVAAVTSALRTKLQQDGSFRLATREPGDIVLSSELVEYDRSALSFDPDDVLVGRDYEVRLLAHVQAVEKASGRTLLDRTVEGETMVRSGADLTSAERQAVPLLAEDLARRVTELLVEGHW